MIRFLVVCCVLFAPHLQAQIVDQGTLSIRRDGQEIGQERFVVRQGRQGEVVETAITTTATFGRLDSTTEYTAVLQRDQRGRMVAFQLDLPPTDPTRRILAAASGGRLTVRSLGRQSESARQWPVAPRMVVLADSVFALYAAVADFATEEGAALTAIFPRSGDRVSFTATQVDAGPAGRRIELMGGIRGTIRLDAEGRLQGLVLPDAGLSLERRSR